MGNDNAKPESRYNFELTEENEIGKGQFGKVYLVSTVDKQTLCAAKFFNLAYKYMTEQDQLSQERELYILKTSSHPFVVKYIDEFKYQDQLCIVTQYASGGDLQKLMDGKNTFQEDEVMTIFSMILIALHYLHRKGIVHRDLKPANIIFDHLPGGTSILKIGDFGISKVNLSKMKVAYATQTGVQTSPAYVAPEIMKQQIATSKVDMWALGIILYQLLTSNHPFQYNDYYAMMAAIKDNKPAPLPETISPWIKDIVDALLDKNPDNRPDTEALIIKDEIKVYIEKIISSISRSDQMMGKQLYSQTQYEIPISNIMNASLCSINKEENEFLQVLFDHKLITLKLYYRGSQDGWTYEDFHSRCDSKNTILSLFQIQNGDCIGGFTHAQQSSPSAREWIKDQNAMLFNLTSERYFPCVSPTDAVRCMKESGQEFGMGELLAFKSPFNQDKAFLSWANQSGYNIPVDSEGINMLTNLKYNNELSKNHCWFTVSELEVWGVTFKE